MREIKQVQKPTHHNVSVSEVFVQQNTIMVAAGIAVRSLPRTIMTTDETFTPFPASKLGEYTVIQDIADGTFGVVKSNNRHQLRRKDML